MTHGEILMPYINPLATKAYDAIRRCHNPKHPRYSDYGGRGIGVHPDWRNDAHQFVSYLETLPGSDNPKLVLDRIDNNRGYEFGNLRFITRSESQRNQRCKGSIPFRGVRLSTNGKKYQTQISIKGKQLHLGSFDTPEEASKVYQEACKALA